MDSENHVFDVLNRTYQSPALRNESSFSFLNRSARPASEKVRLEIENWYRRYPDPHRSELRGRLRSDNCDDFQSAFFELYLHELFLKLDAEISIHHPVGTKGKNPDFSVRFNDHRQLVVVEALVFTDESCDLFSERKRRHQLLDEIDKVQSPYFSIGITVIHEDQPGRIAPRRVCAFLDRELGKLDPDTVHQEYQSRGTCPRLEFADDGCLIDFMVIPKSRRAREGNESRLVAMCAAETRWGGANHSLSSVLSAKSKKYGDLGKPYIIAINAVSGFTPSPEEVRYALFGEERDYVSAATNEVVVRHIPNGLWGTPVVPKYTRVSGVLVGHVFPWSVTTSDFCLYHNPWASIPLPSFNHPFSQATWANGVITYTQPRQAIHDVFGLPEDWPGALFGES